MPAFTTSAPLRLVSGSKSLDREATLEPNGDVLRFGMHGPVADHYKAKATDPQPSTIDYLAASIGGCLIGTFAGSLLRARIKCVPADALTGVVHGEVVPDEDGVLNLQAVRVDYTLALDEEQRAAAQEVHDAHAARCPNARSVTPAIAIETTVTFTDPA